MSGWIGRLLGPNYGLRQGGDTFKSFLFAAGTRSLLGFCQPATWVLPSCHVGSAMGSAVLGDVDFLTKFMHGEGGGPTEGVPRGGIPGGVPRGDLPTMGVTG